MQLICKEKKLKVFLLVLGALGIIWTILWLSTVGDSPSEDIFISNIEKQIIKKSIGKLEENVIF